MTRLVPCCSLCDAQIEPDADGPCCPGASIEMVELRPAAEILGVTRPPVLGADDTIPPLRADILAVIAAVDRRSRGRQETPRHDRILRAVCERLLYGAVMGDAWLALSGADYERVMDMSDLALRAHVIAHLWSAPAQLAVAS